MTFTEYFHEHLAFAGRSLRIMLLAFLAAGTVGCAASPLDITEPRPLALTARLSPVGSQGLQARDTEPRRAINQAPEEAPGLPWAMNKSSGLAVTPASPKGIMARPAAAASAPQGVAPSVAAVAPPAAQAPVAPAPAAIANSSGTASASPPDRRVWSVLREQKSLRTALITWAGSAGWTLSWELPVDFALDANASYEGTFEDAVTAISNSTWAAAHPFQAVFYRGNKVLRIVNPGASK